jgi:NitT/TauT family transport system substrate-binding protein
VAVRRAAWRRWVGVLVGAAALTTGGVLAGPASAAPRAGPSPSGTLRLGYFPNVTHAPALVGVQGGLFQDALGPHVSLKLFTFNAGPAAVEALLSDSIDASYMGPNPAINAYVQSHGAVRIVAGAASGGAILVVRPGITSAADLKGKVLATPQLGNTQDVALRTWLRQHGLQTTTTGGGDVSIRPEDNGSTVQAFEQHLLDGAWVPEPYASELVAAGGKVLVDERTLWPGGRFATTELVVRTDYLRSHAAIVQRLIQGQQDAIGVIDNDAAHAEQLVGQAIQSATGQSVKASTTAAAFPSITFTNDPLAATVRTQALDAQRLGLLAKANLSGLFDLTILNTLLRSEGKPTVSS